MPYTVIGVMPANSDSTGARRTCGFPWRFPAQVARDYHFLSAVARLKRGVSLQQAQAEMDAIAGRIAELYPAIKKGWGATVDRYVDRRSVQQLRLSLIVLMSAVAGVLLIGCANLANLMMARATLRTREITLRLALGARRGRVIRMLLDREPVPLDARCAARRRLRLRAAPRDPEPAAAVLLSDPSRTSAMDGRVLVFLAVVTILTSIGFGLVAGAAGLTRAAEALKEGGRASSAGRRAVFMRHVFVALQVAAAFILLAGGGLLIRSLDRLMRLIWDSRPRASSCELSARGPRFQLSCASPPPRETRGAVRGARHAVAPPL